MGVYFPPTAAADGTPFPRNHRMALDEQYASKDGAGLQHILLCKVHAGSSEKLGDGGARGNPQFPSGEALTTGVDRHG